MLSIADLIFYIFPILGVILITLVVYLSDHRSKTNKYFAALSTSVVVWLTLIFIADNLQNPEAALSIVRVAIVASKFIAISFVIFCLHFPNQVRTLPRSAYLIAPALLSSILAISPYMVKSVTVDSSGASISEVSWLYTIDTVILLSYFIYGSYCLFTQRKVVNNIQRNQINFIFTGIAIAIFINLFTNYLYPLISGEKSINAYGGLSLSIFVGFTAYAIIRHQLFNIKLLVIRSLGYVLSIGFVVLILALLSSLLVQRIFESDVASWVPTVINTAVFVIAVLTYPYVKKFFDRFTNRFFFRDAYDPQEFLDQLNKSIVSNIEIGILLRRTTAIIEENIKSSFVQIVIPKTESTEGRIVGTNEEEYSEHEINYMRGRLVGLGRKIVTADDLGPEEDELQKIFNKNDISVLVHLAATSYGQSQTIAYMIFGNKKSGNIYSKADIKIIEIVADELVIAIQNALRFEEIQEFNVTLQNKVNTATNKLRKTNVKLKAMDETKDEFISMASHQLRTPLTSVKGYLSMVLEGDAGEINDTQRKLLDQAFVSSQRMVYLIADLLNVSRLRTGKFIIDAHPANLAEMVDGEISQLIGQAKAKNITLTFEKPAEFPELLIDETKTRQVVMNFVDNALYYTPSGGKIDVSLSQDKGHVYFQVKDNGLGVPKDEQKHLFTKFYRAKNARNIRPDGTGLGLFMAKKVITAQGGNILFSSVEGKGSTFGFSFNKKHLALERAEELKQENLVGGAEKE